MKKVCDEVSDEFGRKKPNERSFVGRLGKLGLKINGGRDRPCVPGDPGIFITTVKRGSVFDKVLGPGDKILKVTVVCARVLRVYQYIRHSETKETEAGQANPAIRMTILMTLRDTAYQFPLQNELRAKPAPLATTGHFWNHFFDCPARYLLVHCFIQEATAVVGSCLSS